MGTALDVHTDVYSLDENQDVISIKGQMPSFFSFGDKIRSHRVTLYGITFALLVYPKGSRKSSNGLTQVFLRNYTDMPRILNMCVSFRGQEKKAKNVILGGRRCIFIGDFNPPKEDEGHSPYIALKLTVSVQGGWGEKSVFERTQDELRTMIQSERLAVDQIREAVSSMTKARESNETELKGSVKEIKQQLEAVSGMVKAQKSDEAELKGLVKEIKGELQQIKSQIKRKLPECICTYLIFDTEPDLANIKIFTLALTILKSSKYYFVFSPNYCIFDQN